MLPFRHVLTVEVLTPAHSRPRSLLLSAAFIFTHAVPFPRPAPRPSLSAKQDTTGTLDRRSLYLTGVVRRHRNRRRNEYVNGCSTHMRCCCCSIAPQVSEAQRGVRDGSNEADTAQLTSSCPSSSKGNANLQRSVFLISSCCSFCRLAHNPVAVI